MNVPVEHNLHSCSRLFRFLLPLFSNETLLRLSVTRHTSAVSCFTGSAAAAVAPRTDFFSDAHAYVPRVVGTPEPISCSCLPTPMTLASGGVRCSRLWSTSQLLRLSGQQCSHSGRVCPQIQGRQCGAYVGAVEEMMCVVCVDVT